MSNHELVRSILIQRIPGTEKYASDPLNLENLAILRWFAEEGSGYGVCLDLGCGVGIATLLLSEIHSYSLGFDIDVESLKRAKKLRGSQRQRANVDFVLADLHSLPLRSESADLVVCSHVLEHIKFPDPVLASIRRVLKDKGVLIVSVPTILWELQLLLRRAKSMLFGLRPWDFSQLFSDFHIHKWPPWRWEMLIKRAEFSILISRGYYFLPIRRMSKDLPLFLYLEDKLFDRFPWKYLGLGAVVKSTKF